MKPVLSWYRGPLTKLPNLLFPICTCPDSSSFHEKEVNPPICWLTSVKMETKILYLSQHIHQIYESFNDLGIPNMDTESRKMEREYCRMAFLVFHKPLFYPREKGSLIKEKHHQLTGPHEGSFSPLISSINFPYTPMPRVGRSQLPTFVGFSFCYCYRLNHVNKSSYVEFLIFNTLECDYT